MGSCTRRHFLLTTCFLQMIAVIERQVFDFLGYMWAPIAVNFFHMIFVIFGFYGAYHFRVKYIITYLIWNFIWIGWNAFLICFYLNVGTLDRDSDTLNLGTGSFSWFEVNGFNCKPIYPTNITSDDPYRPIRPERVDDCLVDYPIVEIIHSGVQCLLAFFGILGAILISYIFLDEDDRFDFVNGDGKSPQHTVVHPMYVSYSSIPTSASATLLSNKHHQQQQHHQNLNANSNQHNHSNSYHKNHQKDSLQRINAHHDSQTQLQMQEKLKKSSLISQMSSNNNNNNKNHNTFLIHTNRSNCSASISGSNRKLNNSKLLITQQETLQQQQQHHQQHQQHLQQLPSLNRMLSNNQNQKNFSNEILAQQQQQQQQHINQQQLPFQQNRQLFNEQFYDDSTAKADQVYSNFHPNASNSNNNWPQYAQQHSYDAIAATPTSSHDNTTSSLSYASLQNSNATIQQAAGNVAPIDPDIDVDLLTTASLSNSNFSLTSNTNINNNNNNNNSINNAIYINNSNSNNNNNNNSAGRFARIHSKPKPPKSSSYSSFISNNSLGGGGGGGGGGGLGGGFNSGSNGGGMDAGLIVNNNSNANSITNSGNNLYRPDIKYTQMSNDHLSSNYEEAEDDNFSLRNFKADGAVTYVPFQKPTPSILFPSPANTNSNQNSYNNNNNNSNNNSIFPTRQQSPNNNDEIMNNNHHTPGYGILLEHGAILQPAFLNETTLNAANLHQHHHHHHHSMSGSSSPAASLTPRAYRRRYRPQQQSQQPMPHSQQPTRPTNIPLPKIPSHRDRVAYDELDSPMDMMPSPPPPPMSAARPHIFQPRSGHAHFPDLSPEVTEKYAMPTQYIPRSPVAVRIVRRQRENSKLANTSANFCDQIRHTKATTPTRNIPIRNQTATTTTTPQMGGNSMNGLQQQHPNILRAKSHDGLSPPAVASSSSSSSPLPMPLPSSQSSQVMPSELAPHVSRRSGRREAGGGGGPKNRPRSYCNSITSGEDVIRGIALPEIVMGAHNNGNFTPHIV